MEFRGIRYVLEDVAAALKAGNIREASDLLKAGQIEAITPHIVVARGDQLKKMMADKAAKRAQINATSGVTPNRSK